MIGIQDTRLDPLAIASATDCPLWSDLAGGSGLMGQRLAPARNVATM
jgi:hypothetical protein